MIFEFAGLPGSGKSTIFTAAAERLTAVGLPHTTMRMLAKAALEADYRKIGFLRRRTSRASLYGALAFGDEHPALFDALLAAARGDLSTRLWNMEMLAQLHFGHWRGLPDHPVFMDEGYLHRGAGSYLLTRDAPGFREYVALIPMDRTVVHVMADVDLAYARSQGRKIKKRIPAAWLGASEAETRATLDYFNELLRTGCALLRARGARIIEIDAKRPLAETAAALAEAVIAAQEAAPG